jgi:tetratricopeptide (TPR) repeat protein
MLKRLAVPLAAIFLCLSGTWWASEAARETWVSVRANQLLVVGNSSEKEIRLVATRLEQFREAISQVFTGPSLHDRVPTTVIVFKNDDDYRPFKMSDNNAGYFQPGKDVNYITLSTEVRGEQDPFTIIFHEYTHLLVNNSIGTVPPWFNEGLAEYYSSLSIGSDRKVIVGRPIQRHLMLLRRNPLLPLRTLFHVDYKSPHYNEGHKQSIFYAESWALIHYLLTNKNGLRTSQMWKFLELTKEGVAVEPAFQKSFETTFEGLENELRHYIRQDYYRMFEANLANKASNQPRLTTAPVSDAQAQAYLGDLLVHSSRPEAEEFLLRAIKLDPNLEFAHAALGMLRFRQSKWSEALVNLERAVASETADYLIRYSYAFVLSRQRETDRNPAFGFSSESAAKARPQLKKAISLRPDFPDSYNLLAYVNLVTNTDIDETIETLQRALVRLPGRIDFIYMLGQLYMHKDDYKQAKPLLEQVVKGQVEDRVRRHAELLISTMANIEEQRLQKEAALRARGLNPDTSTMAGYANQTPNPSSELRQFLRIPPKGEMQKLGKLLSIECEQGGLVFVVKTSDRVLRLHTQTFQQIRRTTYTADVRGTLTCGKRQPENAVVVCYLPADNKTTKTDGVLSSVEFVPEDFTLMP